MKTNKLWSIMTVLVLTLGTTLTFSSCGKDDDNDESATQSMNSQFVGSWRMPRSAGWEPNGDGFFDFRRHVLKKDGTLEIYNDTEYWVAFKCEKIDSELDDKGTWTYDPTKEFLTLRGARNVYYYYVTHIDDKGMVWLGLDGNYTTVEKGDGPSPIFPGSM